MIDRERANFEHHCSERASVYDRLHEEVCQLRTEQGSGLPDRSVRGSMQHLPQLEIMQPEREISSRSAAVGSVVERQEQQESAKETDREVRTRNSDAGPIRQMERTQTSRVSDSSTSDNEVVTVNDLSASLGGSQAAREMVRALNGEMKSRRMEGGAQFDSNGDVYFVPR
ncbi:MAG: hypothetical protein K2W95_35965 [Candidatus Obscuribacterales bacterium]|nr:hypothetical protein [Candidatus Obscuribacterales bacterium]